MTTTGTPASQTTSNTTVIRVIAGTGMLFLIGAWVLSAALALVDAHDTDGTAGPLVSAGFTVLWPAAIAGLAALFLPAGTMTARVRGWITAIQYALTVAAPVLVALDA
ncbi:hypothetical protein ACIBCM_14155 [Streptomyces sp. NPDC051018]|uniref:hypothetical protein n=1 Tax=Streptomyces sp. NPDC051018 TaxID=3365639 RepID=UPI00378D8522